MVFRMSYGAPPAAPAKPAAKPGPKKAASPRVRKPSSLHAKAEALFDPNAAPAKDPAQD